MDLSGRQQGVHYHLKVLAEVLPEFQVLHLALIRDGRGINKALRNFETISRQILRIRQTIIQHSHQGTCPIQSKRRLIRLFIRLFFSKKGKNTDSNVNYLLLDVFEHID